MSCSSGNRLLIIGICASNREYSSLLEAVGAADSSAAEQEVPPVEVKAAASAAVRPAGSTVADSRRLPTPSNASMSRGVAFVSSGMTSG